MPWGRWGSLDLVEQVHSCSCPSHEFCVGLSTPVRSAGDLNAGNEIEQGHETGRLENLPHDGAACRALQFE
jgi:hypothetical protein